MRSGVDLDWFQPEEFGGVCPQNEHGEKRLDLASASRLPSAIAATASQDDFPQI
jgi:hypothetical protein